VSAHLARLIRPRAHALVERERLFASLDDARARSVIWISAPAGAGKTSLVASYLEQRRRTGPWIQLERPDGDPAAFFHFLRLAASAVPGVSAERLPRHSIEYARDCSGFALRFFRRLHGELGDDSVVVLDNYQELAARSPMHRALASVAGEWPSTGNLVCVSRVDPPSAFARLRAAARLALVDWNAMKLRLDEVQAIVAARHQLSGDLVARLHEQSGGWAAGLVLLLERVRQTGRFEVLDSASDLQAIFDYFADQVFRACPETTREMLLRLSYLPRITASSAARITRRTDAAELLAGFARRNLFIGQSTPQDASFEFHSLFRAFLQHRARASHGEAGHARLIGEAAELLLTGGLVDDAVQCLLEARAWRRAREIVLQEAPRMVATGRRESLRRWIGALPRRMLDDPWLAYWLGVSCSGHDAHARTQALERAYAAFEASGERRGQVLALSAQMSGWWGERDDFRWLDPVLDRLARLVSTGGELERETEAAAVADLVNAWPMLRPMRDEVHEFARRLRRLPLRELPPAPALHVGVCLMAYFWMRGDSDELDAVARAVHALVEDPEAALTDRLWFHFWTMTHHVYRADATRAMEAMECARTTAEEANLAPGHVDLARWATTVDMQLGRADRARRRLDDELVPLLSAMAPTAAVFVHLELTRCAIEEGRIDEALKQGRTAAAVALRCGYTWAQVPARLSWCGALCLDGRPTQARRQLARVRRLVTERIPMQLASVEFYEALVCLTEGDCAGARRARALLRAARDDELCLGSGMDASGRCASGGLRLRERRLPRRHDAHRARSAPAGADTGARALAVVGAHPRLRCVLARDRRFRRAATTDRKGRAPADGVAEGPGCCWRHRRIGGVADRRHLARCGRRHRVELAAHDAAPPAPFVAARGSDLRARQQGEPEPYGVLARHLGVSRPDGCDRDNCDRDGRARRAVGRFAARGARPVSRSSARRRGGCALAARPARNDAPALARSRARARPLARAPARPARCGRGLSQCDAHRSGRRGPVSGSDVVARRRGRAGRGARELRALGAARAQPRNARGRSDQPVARPARRCGRSAGALGASPQYAGLPYVFLSWSMKVRTRSGRCRRCGKTAWIALGGAA